MNKLLSIYTELQVSCLVAVTDIQESPDIGRKPSTGGAVTNEKHEVLETGGGNLTYIFRAIRRNFAAIKQEQNAMQKGFGKQSDVTV